MHSLREGLISLLPEDVYPIKLDSSSVIAVGVDIGGSWTKIGLVNRLGQVLFLTEFATQIDSKDPSSYINKLIKNLRQVIRMADHPLKGIGITFLGWINAKRTGPYFCMNAPALHNFDFKSLIEQEFGLPVAVHDDVTAHTLAEYTFGCGRGTTRFLCLAMGTGLGAGVIVDGKPLDYTGGCAGDTGHILLRPGGPQCSAGCRGCAEALIGVGGIERMARERYSTPQTAAAVIAACAGGADPLAEEIMQQIGEYTGELLASLFPVFVPERMALTGGTTRAGVVLLDSTRRRFTNLMDEYCRSYEVISGTRFTSEDILFGELPTASAVIGAVVDLFE